MANNGKFHEDDFEMPFVKLLEAEGWTYTHGAQIHRKYTDPIIERDLRDFLAAQYSPEQLSKEETDYAVAKLRNVSGQNEYEMSREAYYLYRDGYDVTPSNPTLDAYKLKYIDFENIENNTFRCVNQFTMIQGKENRRPDILLFVNGIPVCVFELKNPADENATIRDAHTQVTVRYVRDISELMKYCTLAVISDGAKNKLGTPFSDFEYFYEWKKVENNDKPGKGLDALQAMIKGVLAPARLLEILRDYVYYPDPINEDDTTEVVCRYPQFFATRKLRDNIISHLRSVGGDGKGGTYFGATGCGKTYTMLFLSRQLIMRCKEQLGSPTILIIVDREDLETQAAKLFCKSTKYLEDNAIRVFESRNDLATEMRTRTTGGVYITTVQMFAESTGLLTDRSNVVCMSDEAHRTQNNLGSSLSVNDGTRGKKTDMQNRIDKEVFALTKDDSKIGAKVTYGFAKYLRDALPNATYVGFTGTPIDETIHVFGDVVDEYTMRQSQDDEITVPIKYDPRLARVFMDRAQADKVEAYYRLCADDGATAEDIKKSKEAMSSLQMIIGDEDVLRRVASDIIADYKKRTEQTERIQKAMITCIDRPTAYKLYKIMREIEPAWFEKKKALDESLLTDEEKKELREIAFVNMVMTRDKNDEKEMYSLLGDKKHRKFLDNEFKSERSNFHISINVDMWITGFDVPCLTMLYNDKPLSKHTLIQTISRVNRKYKDKEFGYVVDYIGIREEMKKAMKRYGGDVSPKEDLVVAHEILANELQILKEMMSKLDFTPFFGDDDLKRLFFLQQAAEYILANTVEEKGVASFLKMYKEHVKRLRAAFNICSPAGMLSDEEIMWSQCFMGVCSYVIKMTATEHDTISMNKHVEQMVKEAILASGVERVINAGEEENIYGEKFTEEVDDMKMPNTRFQMLCKMVARAIKAYGRVNKIKAEEFQKMLEATVDEYNTRDKLTFTNTVTGEVVEDVSSIVNKRINELSEKLKKILEDLKVDSEKFKELGISFEEKAFYDVLTEVRDKHKFEYPQEKCIALAKKINEEISNTAVYADWTNNDNLKAKLAIQINYILYKEGYPPTWDEEVFEKVMEQVNNYKRNECCDG